MAVVFSTGCLSESLMELQEKKKGLGLMVRDSDILGPTRPGCLITLSSVGGSVVNSEPRSAHVSSYLNSVMELVSQWDLQPTNRKRAAKGARYLKLIDLLVPYD